MEGRVSQQENTHENLFPIQVITSATVQTFFACRVYSCEQLFFFEHAFLPGKRRYKLLCRHRIEISEQ